MNLLGQVFPGKPKFKTGIDTQQKREYYFQQGMNNLGTYLLNKHAHDITISLAFPYRIGCGAAGGDWDIYVSMIKNFYEKYQYRGIILKKENV